MIEKITAQVNVSLGITLANAPPKPRSSVVGA